MLSEVKKEVDIMVIFSYHSSDVIYMFSQRLLKGHPNIVHLIDAAWHKLPNGTYEVFILMEFCPGNLSLCYKDRRPSDALKVAE